ncbi:hypothetical protein [Mesorhizobium sp. M0088]|uniref:hypothetical protein n=1 Tax=Mesorhizobium sp. M0088 TaxID=2956873 RepID=UPI0033355237
MTPTQPTHTTTEALEGIRDELDFLLMAIGAGDPKAELRLRVKDLIASVAALSTAPSGDGVPGMVLDPAIADVAAERRRQIEAEGWTAKHDDDHDKGEMARAAACYALADIRSATVGPYDIENRMWPWDLSWWKPSSPRRNLVKAGALIAAEIERLDRLSTASTAGEPKP